MNQKKNNAGSGEVVVWLLFGAGVLAWFGWVRPWWEEYRVLVGEVVGVGRLVLWWASVAFVAGFGWWMVRSWWRARSGAGGLAGWLGSV